MKKIICFTGILLALVFCFQTAVLANPECHWYCKQNKCNQRPPIPPEFSFCQKYGCYFLDQHVTDTSSDRVVYLTFDAGYENGNVEKTLDILLDAGTPGAFFLLSHFVTANSDLVERMKNEGHTICNHTARHKNLCHADKASIESEIHGLEEAVFSVIGEKPAMYFRPPEGSFSEELLSCVQEMGYKTVFWSVAYADWDNERQMPPEKALKIVQSKLHNGAVILLHPTSKTNTVILPELIASLKKEGYRFGTLDELCAE